MPSEINVGLGEHYRLADPEYLVEMAIAYSQQAKQAKNPKDRRRLYDQKMHLAILAITMHSETFELGSDKGLIMITYKPNPRLRFHLVPRKLRGHIRGNGYHPLMRHVLFNIFGIEPKKGDKSQKDCQQQRHKQFKHRFEA